MSWLFIRTSNQQSDQDIARSLQFCDSSLDCHRSNDAGTRSVP